MKFLQKIRLSHLTDLPYSALSEDQTTKAFLGSHPAQFVGIIQRDVGALSNLVVLFFTLLYCRNKIERSLPVFGFLVLRPSTSGRPGKEAERMSSALFCNKRLVGFALIQATKFVPAAYVRCLENKSRLLPRDELHSRCVSGRL